MNKQLFVEFAKKAGLELANADSCVVLKDASDFNAIKPLLDSGEVCIERAHRKAGESWFNRFPGGVIYEDEAVAVAKEMASSFKEFLEYQNRTARYYDSCIANRNQLLAEHPPAAGEKEGDWFERIEEEVSLPEAPAPWHVNEPGFWCYESERCILSDSELKNGIWSYEDDNWRMVVIAVLDDDGDKEGEEE